MRLLFEQSNFRGDETVTSEKACIKLMTLDAIFEITTTSSIPYGWSQK